MKFPVSCTAYGDAATSAQRAHFWVVRSQLSLAVLGSLVAAVLALPESPVPPSVGFPVIVGCFVVGIVVQSVSSQRQFEKRWYGFRAVRESQKSLVWQYATGLGAFAIGDTTAESAFSKRLKEAEEEFPFAPPVQALVISEEESFRSQLESIRKSEWHIRRDTYLRDRVDDQIRWYGSRARSNSRASNILDASAITIQTVGLVFSVVFLALGFNGASLLALAMAALAAVLAWGRAKQYSSLVEPYSNAQRELLRIQHLIRGARAEAEFVEAAGQAEEAISREHSLWSARKGLYRW